jgi:hypothetical protein
VIARQMERLAVEVRKARSQTRDLRARVAAVSAALTEAEQRVAAALDWLASQQQHRVKRAAVTNGGAGGTALAWPQPPDHATAAPVPVATPAEDQAGAVGRAQAGHQARAVNGRRAGDRVTPWAALSAVSSTGQPGNGLSAETSSPRQHPDDTELPAAIVRRLFAAGLSLHAAAERTTQPEVQQRIETALDEIDQAIREVRDNVFGNAARPSQILLRDEVLDFIRRLPQSPKVSFSGRVDAKLPAEGNAELLRALRQAFGLIGEHATVARVHITVRQHSYVLVIDAVPLPAADETSGTVHTFASIRDRAAETGNRIDMRLTPQGVRFAWHAPESRAKDEPCPEG